MPRFDTAIPLLHRECKLLPNVPLLLDDNIAVRSLKSEHIGAIITKRRSLSERLNSKTKCILVQSGDSKTSKNVIENVALLGPFVLNVFAKSGASVCEQAFTIKHVRSHSVIEVTELTSLSAATYANYEIETGTKPAAVKTLYSSAVLALSKDPGLSITMRRFNGALSKTAHEDKVIDIAICLESMFNSQTEISFRFSLYNAILAEEDSSKRGNLFKTLKKLYAQRSNLVHGNKSLDTVWVTDQWDTIVRAAKLSLLKKIEFLQDNPIGSWQDHLDKLALGV